MTQTKVGWRAYVASGGGVDTDAQAFITAAAITNTTQQLAINTLVTDLKGYGIWSKMKALYPMVGGSATSHKFNLKDPRDLDAAYRLVFNGGWTHSSTGALPNGTTAYADTKINPSVVIPLINHLSYYSRTNVSGIQVEMGIYDSTSLKMQHLRVANAYQSGNLAGGTNFTSTTDSRGFWLGTRRSTSDKEVYKNGTSEGTYTTLDLTENPNKLIYIGARNENPSAANFSSKECAFASIGDGLTDTEAANFYTSVQKFQTTLGRQIGSPIVSDTDAQAFINAAGLTDLGQASAINTLVTDLKTANIWTKMKAVYPFVGGTATSHKFNLKDPRDLNAAFRLVFTGGWTHTSTGALPNGTNAWANTYFSEYVNITNNDTQLSNFSHASIYSRTNSPSINQYGGIGVNNSQDGYGYFTISPKRADGLSYGAARGTLFTTPTNIADSRGLFLINRQSNSLLKYSRDNSLISQNTTLNNIGASRIAFYLGAINDWGSAAYFDNKEHSFITLGNSLTDTEATAFYTAVQKYQTSLGRQVGTPVLAEGQTAGLLETYSGAAAAYSLRKLRNGYVGNAIRVRRSSDNAEQNIAFDASGNLDTVSLLAFVGSGNGFVTTWYDQSGNDGNLIQTTAANQPQIVSSGSLITRSGKPYFTCSTTQYFTLASMFTVINTPYSMWMTYEKSATGNNSVIGSTSINYMYLDYGTSQYLSTASNSLITISPALSINTRYVINGLVNKVNTGGNNLTSSLYINNSLRGTKDTSSPWLASYASTQAFPSSTSGFRVGTITTNEWIVYKSDQTSNRTGIESNINSYYSIY